MASFRHLGDHRPDFWVGCDAEATSHAVLNTGWRWLEGDVLTHKNPPCPPPEAWARPDMASCQGRQSREETEVQAGHLEQLFKVGAAADILHQTHLPQAGRPTTTNVRIIVLIYIYIEITNQIEKAGLAPKFTPVCPATEEFKELGTCFRSFARKPSWVAAGCGGGCFALRKHSGKQNRFHTVRVPCNMRLSGKVQLSLFRM